MKKIHAIIIRDTAIYIAVSVLLLAGIAGVHAWPKNQRAVGYFTLAKNPWGIAIFQPGVHTTVQWNGYTTVSQNNNTVLLKTTGTTMPSIDFGRDDIIFDSEGNLYTESKESEIQALSTLSGIPLKKIQVSDKTISTDSARFFLVNPHIPGVMTYIMPENSITTIDRETKKITNTAATPITIKIYDSMPIAGSL